MSRDWTFFLEDILDAAEKVLRYTQGMTFEEFRDNEMVVDAVLRNLEIIGEAAKSLPVEARAMMPDVEWSKATGFRNVVAHHYFGLSLYVVWDVVLHKVPDIESSARSLHTKLNGGNG